MKQEDKLNPWSVSGSSMHSDHSNNLKESTTGGFSETFQLSKSHFYKAITTEWHQISTCELTGSEKAAIEKDSTALKKGQNGI